MLVVLLLRSIIYIYIYYYCYFSTEAPASTVTGEGIDIPVLEDISEEEMEVAPASGSKEATPKGVKLKVPQK